MSPATQWIGRWIVWTLATIGLALAVLAPDAIVHVWVGQRIGMARATAMPWIALLIDHAVMTLVALILIALLSRGRMGEYGLQKPRGKSYLGASIGWGIFFGVLMTVADYLPSLLAHKAPESYPLTPANIGGWLVFSFVYVGFTEEIPFRGLLQTFLMQRTTGRIRIGHYDMHAAGVVLAVLFALAHVSNFWVRPFWAALAQQVYAIALGILYAYWREKSGSLTAAVIGHNLSDGIELSIVFFLEWIWR
ncbi:MAG: CPBP family intramembrane glutamic endopeptidase [Candidatus Acidiferrales bacterium]